MKRLVFKETSSILDYYSCKTGKRPSRKINGINVEADFIASNEQELKYIAKNIPEQVYTYVLCDGMMYEIKKYTDSEYIVSILLAANIYYE